jgi:hypothetical protein
MPTGRNDFCAASGERGVGDGDRARDVEFEDTSERALDDAHGRALLAEGGRCMLPGLVSMRRRRS